MKIKNIKSGSALPSKGVYLLPASQISEILSSLKDDHYRVDIKGARTREELLASFAQNWNFPPYFGNNWDAFEEVLRELPPEKVYVIDGEESFRKRILVESELLRSVVREVLSKRALVLLVQR
jgi:hypothetical protein